MEILLIFAFISGLVTILAPCIWPILPIVLSSTITGGKLKPLGVSIGISLSFGFFLLAISYVVKIFNVDPNIFRLLAVLIIGFLGLTLVIPKLAGLVESWVSKLTTVFGINKNSRSGFFGGLLTGLSLGIVWAPCAGPILAAIATLAATNQVTFSVLLVAFAYIIGVGIPLFIFAYGGQKLVQKSRFISAYTGIIQQVFGVVMILTALAIYTNYDKVIQVQLLNLVPGYSNLLTGFENSSVVQRQLDILKKKAVSESSQVDLQNLGQAPEFVGISKWLNTEQPLTLAGLKGKVVLVDFWTYTCINCIRTLPFVTGWYEKYKDQGFIVVGVHTPEFEFEKNTQNVLNATLQYKIHYPVAQDNNYLTWNAFNNNSWPAEYLIDSKGVIRYTHFGEGHYDLTEQAIQNLLKEANQNVSSGMLNLTDQTPNSPQTPETYLGSKRAENYYPNGGIVNGLQSFNLASNLPINTLSLVGSWTVSDDNITSAGGASLEFNFYSNQVFLVIHPPANQSAKLKVMLDGKVVDSSNEGNDVQEGIITVDTPRLYNLINLQGKKGQHLLHLEFQTPGTEAFAFTFG